jgi:adenine-specific DNA-methyltransferase
VIKYIGSKRRLVGVIGALATGARTAIDLFTGTTRVAQELRRGGAVVTAVDTSRYSEVFARAYLDAGEPVSDQELAEAVRELDALPGRAGYMTETFCVESRFFTPENGARIDAIRAAIDDRFGCSPLRPYLLTSLIEAADRVDSTTGVQMAYLKQWAPRALRPLVLRVPNRVTGPPGHALRADASSAAAVLPAAEVAYLDPPYNRHRYDANYHVWETLVAWDAPPAYGVARKRADLREVPRSAFNDRRAMPAALRQCVAALDVELLVLSFNAEGFLALDELVELCRARGEVEVLSFAQPRYVGAKIGIHSPSGEKVGTVSHVTTTEHLLVAGERPAVRRAVTAATAR